MKECIFCKIVKGNVSSEKVYEDDDFLAFADANPVGEGHTLVIPKKHFENLLELDEKLYSSYLSAIKKTAKILMEKYDAAGFNIALNNGKLAGQIINHVHFHILPRKENDGKKGFYLA